MDKALEGNALAKDELDRILDAALALAARRGWKAVALRDVAAAAGLPLSAVQRRTPSLAAILKALIARVDQAVLLGPKPDPAAGARDRLFDVLMRRLDALAPHKAGVRAIVHDLAADPLAALRLVPRMADSMAWMLEAAGIDGGGWRGRLRANGLAIVYLATLRVWLDDESADGAKTMAALDRALRQGERGLRICEEVAEKIRARTPSRAAPEPGKTARARSNKSQKSNKK